MIDTTKLTITGALQGLREHRFTAVDLVLACLAEIEKHNKEYNVLLTVLPKENLLRQAGEINRAGYDLPLAGIPIVAKDMFSTTNVRTTAASKVLDNYIPVYDATVIAKLKDAGAIIVGKANQDAWAHGATGENSQYGPTRNAFDKTRVAGGSSSGSAAAVALGMALAAVGTDTGGSIRVPAMYNNLVGLKPTYGRVSRYGVVAMASSLDSMGHVTHNVADSAKILRVTAGWDRYDATSLNAPVPNYEELINHKSLKELKVGVSADFQTEGIEKRLCDAYQKAISIFEKLGAKIIPVSLPNVGKTIETYYIIVPSEISSNLARYDGIRFGYERNKFGEEARRRIMIGTYSLSSGYYDAYYKTAQKVRTLILTDLQNALGKVDIILAPVAPVLPYKIGEKVNDLLTLYLMDIFTAPVNLSGLPSLALPVGFADKLPVGIQIIGKSLAEDQLFAVGQAFEGNV